MSSPDALPTSGEVLDALRARRQAPPLSEGELLAGYGVLLSPAGEVIETLELIAREVATLRELVELLVSWAGIDPEAHRSPDEPPPDAIAAATRSWGDVLGESEP